MMETLLVRVANILVAAFVRQRSPRICSANQWTGFYMIMASVMKELSSLVTLQQANKQMFTTEDKNDEGPYHIEISSLIGSANQFTGFYKIGTSIMKGLISNNFSKNSVLTVVFEHVFTSLDCVLSVLIRVLCENS